MQSLKKYIAVSLCLVLLVPLVYQSVHMITEHGHLHHYCTTPDLVFHEAEDSADCPVCEYEFAKYCIASNSPAIDSAVDSTAPETPFKKGFIHFYTGTNISLRGPPHQS